MAKTPINTGGQASMVKTLRDEFAVAALASVRPEGVAPGNERVVARYAYAIADAMLAERAKE